MDDMPEHLPDQMSELDRLKLSLEREKLETAKLRFEAAREAYQKQVDVWQVEQQKVRTTYKLRAGETVDLDTGRVNRTKDSMPTQPGPAQA
jgi:hypothetical protein